MFHTLSNKEYHRGAWKDHLNASAIKVLIDKTPAHFWHYRNNPPETTKNMEIGTATHTAVLEPEKLSGQVAIAPDVDMRTNMGKAEHQMFLNTPEGNHDNAIAVLPKMPKAETKDFREKHKGKIILSAAQYMEILDIGAQKGYLTPAAGKIILKQDELDNVHAMAAAVLANDTAARLLDLMPDREKSIEWFDPTFKTMCKARPDMFGELILDNGANLICDLKTTAESAAAFQRIAMKFDYHIQSGWYRRGMKAVTGKDWEFGFIVVEKSPPHCVAFYLMNPDQNLFIDDAIEKAGYDFARCQAKNSWPGWSEKLQTLDLTPRAENALVKFCEED